MTIASSLPPTSIACGAHMVSSMDAPLSSRRCTDRLLVSPPSRFMMVARSPTVCTTPMTSAMPPTKASSMDAIFWNL